MPDMLSRPSQSGIFIPLIGAPRLSLPMDEPRVSAGFPSPAADSEDKRFDINGQLTHLSDRSFWYHRQRLKQHGQCSSLRERLLQRTISKVVRSPVFIRR